MQEKGGISEKDSKIADIVFAFNNRDALVLLRKRYEYLCKAQFEKAEKIEDKLTQLKNEKYCELVVPNTFFCTFMEGKAQ